MGRITGTVDWFNNAKGYGFIKRDDKPEDVFVHYSSIAQDGYRKLHEGDRVSFVLENGPRSRMQAGEVTLL